MPIIPATVLKKLYVQGSLRREEDGFAFDLKNLIAPATIVSVHRLDVDGDQIDNSKITIRPPSGNVRAAGQISSGRPLVFPVGMVVTVHVSNGLLEQGQHALTLHVDVKEIGSLDIPISDDIA